MRSPDLRIDAEATAMDGPRSVLVVGDPTIDWYVSLTSATPAYPQARLTTEVEAYWHRGGAFLLSSLIEEKLGASLVHGIRPDAASTPSPTDSSFHHTFSTIMEYPACEPEGAGSDKPLAKVNQPTTLRVERFLGTHKGDPDLLFHGENDTGLDDLGVIAVDDAHLGYGSKKNKKNWDRDLRHAAADGSCPWLLIKLGGTSLGRKGLWRRISGLAASESDIRNGASLDIRNRLIVVVKIDTLRDFGAGVTKDLSWERSAQDVIAELKSNPRLASLSGLPRLAITFGPTGALLIDRPWQEGSESPYTLFFHQHLMEGFWEQKHQQCGQMVGFGEIFAAHLAAALAQSPAPDEVLRKSLEDELHENMCDALEDSVSSITVAHRRGYRREDSKIIFPVECMTKFRIGDKRVCGVERASVPDPLIIDPPPSKNWSILAETLETQDPYEIAMEVVDKGPEGLGRAPYAHFSGMYTADRREIEGLRSVRRLITGYWDRGERVTAPRSIAVFGNPGDGKSYCVKAVAKHVYDVRGAGEEPPFVKFNLSQFSGPKEVIEALHIVRDKCLAGDIPIVFWDEFDVQVGGEPFGWLRWFLEPMSDGQFVEGQTPHSVGRAIFVFAGGICQEFAEFAERVSRPECANSKGPDFISRLDGYLDIVGPNPRNQRLIDEPDRIVNRALILHGILMSVDQNIEDSEYGVKRAFLQIPRYYHGARSMRAIVEMSSLHKSGRLTRSALPPPNQLQLHVDAEEFMRIARSSTQAG